MNVSAAEAMYLHAMEEKEKAWVEVDRLFKKVEKSPREEIKEKYRHALRALDAKIKVTFQTFDSYRLVKNTKFAVPEEEVLNLIAETLQTNADALPYAEAGLPSYQQVKRLSKDLLAFLKEENIEVQELDLKIPMCKSCGA